MDYRAADRLSRRNKEFIRGLFPDGDIYASLLAPEAQAVIGEVGPQTKGVEKLLRRIGFRYVNRVDPFDGGPHFLADTDQVSLIQAVSTKIVDEHTSGPTSRIMIGRRYPEAPWFSAATVDGHIVGDLVLIPAEELRELELTMHGVSIEVADCSKNV